MTKRSRRRVNAYSTFRPLIAECYANLECRPATMSVRV